MMKQTSRLLAAAVLAASALVPPGALAQSQAAAAATPAVPVAPAALVVPAASAVPAVPAASSPAAQAATLTDGEIRKIDREAGKLTIRHGEIKHLDMPGMTMVFVAKDKALLDNVKVGDKIRFMVIDENGKMVVTEIEPAK